MADSNISVVISAQTADLQAKLALAQSSLRAFNADMKATADQARAAGSTMDSDLRAKVEQTAASFAQTKAQVDALKGQMAAAAAGVRETAAAHGELNLATSGTTREFIVLGHEAMQGNFNRIPGSIVVLLERMGSLHTIIESITPSMMAAGGAALAFAGVLGYLALQAKEAHEATKEVLGTAAFFDNSVAKAQVDALIAQIHKLPGATYEDAQKVGQAFAGMRETTGPMMQALGDQVANYAKATGEEMPAAAKKMADAFGEPLKNGDEFLKHLNAGRDAFTAFAQAASQGDRLGAITIMLTALTAAAQRHESVVHTVTERQRFWTEVMIGMEAATAGVGVDVERLSKALSSIDAEHVAKVAKDVEAALGSVKTQQLANPTGPLLGQVREQAAAIKTQTDKTNAEILAAELALWQNRLEIGDLKGRDLVEAEKARDDARAAFARANGEQAVSELRLSNARLAAEGTLGKQQLLQAEAAGWARLLASDKLTAEQRLTVERDYQLATAQLVGNGKAEHLKALQAITEEARKGTQLRIAAAQAEYDYALVTYKDGSVQATEAYKHLRLAQQEALDLSVRVTRSIADTNAQLQRMQGEAASRSLATGPQTRSFFDIMFGGGEGDSFNQRMAALRASAESQAAEFRAAFQKMVPTGDFAAALDAIKGFDVALGDTAGLMRQIGAADEANVADIIANLNKARVAQQQYADQVKVIQGEAARTTQREWQQGLAPIGGAFDTLFRNGVMGAGTWRQTQLAILSQVGTGYFNMATKATGEWISGEISKTFATKAGAAARTAAGATEESSFLVRVGSMVAKWLGFESGKTAASSAGSAARVGAETVADAETAVEGGAIRFGEVEGAAAVAAANAFAATAAIPLIGPELAPAAAAAAFSEVMGFAPLASAAGGWGTVPNAGALTMLHAQEMVLPASLANPLRGALQATPAGAALGSAAAPSPAFAPEIHIHAVDARSIRQMLADNRNALVETLRGAHRDFVLRPE